MTTVQLYRLSGIALLLGMLLSIVAAVVLGIAFPDSSSPTAQTNPLNIFLNVVSVVGTFLALLGLPAMYARAARAGGLVWLIGVILIALTGTLFGIFLSLLSAIVNPVIATAAPSLLQQGPPAALVTVFIIGTLANALGALLMGIPMITKQIYPRWCGYLLIVEAVLALAGFFLNGPGPTTLLSQILNIVSPLPLFIVLGWAGYELWSGKVAGQADDLSGTVSPQPA